MPFKMENASASIDCMLIYPSSYRVQPSLIAIWTNRGSSISYKFIILTHLQLLQGDKMQKRGKQIRSNIFACPISYITLNIEYLLIRNYMRTSEWTCSVSRKQLKDDNLVKDRPNTQGSLIDELKNYSRHNKIKQKDQYSKFEPMVQGNYEQEYFRQVENGRLMKSLINPKRDKLIIQSLENVRARGKVTTQGLRNSKQKYRSEHKSKEYEFCPLSPKFYEERSLMVENQRMGNRIINTRSTGLSLSDNQKIKRKKQHPIKKVNEGVKAFFQSQLSQNKSSILQPKPQSLLFLKPYYGTGPTIIAISGFNIQVNPNLRSDDLISLELMTKSPNDKIYRTPGILYGVLQKIQLKFALRLKEIGEFVPLRFWKFNGVNSVELGIIDLQFARYLQKQQILKEKDFNLKQNLAEYRNRYGKRRVVVSEKLCNKLRKSKVDEVQAVAQLNYMIYRKKYI